MASPDLATTLTALLEPRAEEHGLMLVAVEIVGQKNEPTVRVYLDREGGIDIDAIAAANEWVGATLDDVKELSGTYTLEVSSPGIERPLRKLVDFARFVGSTADIRTDVLVDRRKRFGGTIAGVEGSDVLVDVDGTTYRVPHDAIVKAKLRVTIDFGQEGKGDLE
jgi:ribosome maturation factor RimP